MENITKFTEDKIINFFNEKNKANTLSKLKKTELDMYIKQSTKSLLFYLSIGNWKGNVKDGGYDIEISVTKYGGKDVYGKAAEKAWDKGKDIVVRCTRKDYNNVMNNALEIVDAKINEL